MLSSWWPELFDLKKPCPTSQRYGDETKGIRHRHNKKLTLSHGGVTDRSSTIREWAGERNSNWSEYDDETKDDQIASSSHIPNMHPGCYTIATMK
jgi:hypothetical protein